MENENENLASPNEETNVASETTDDVTALKEKNQDLSDKNRQLFERAKKAEGFEKKDDQWVKVAKPEPKVETTQAKPEAKPESQSDEPNYGRLAYLDQKGITNADDKKWVEEEATRIKLPITDVLEMEHVKGHLKAVKTEREAQEGMPSGSKRTGGTTKNQVEYYLQKGGLPDDQKLAEEVVEARMADSPDKRQFDPIR